MPAGLARAGARTLPCRASGVAHLDSVGVSFDDARAPGQGKAGDDGAEPLREAVASAFSEELGEGADVEVTEGRARVLQVGDAVVEVVQLGAQVVLDAGVECRAVADEAGHEVPDDAGGETGGQEGADLRDGGRGVGGVVAVPAAGAVRGEQALVLVVTQ